MNEKTIKNIIDDKEAKIIKRAKKDPEKLAKALKENLSRRKLKQNLEKDSL